MNQPDIESLPVVVIGAGPVGLAAAAHLLERGFDPLVLERGDEPAAAVATWGHVPLFSPWRCVVDRAAERLLVDVGWERPSDEAFPTGAELREQYLLPLAATPALHDRIRVGTEVLLLTGYEQVRSISAAIAGDWDAAARVELELPETGLCSGPGTRVAAGDLALPVVSDGCCA